MSVVRRLRMPVLVLLCLGMGACVRPDGPSPDAGDARPPHTSETGEARGDAESGASGQPREEPAEAETADPSFASEIGTGPEAVSSRREALSASERALDPESLGYFMDVHEARLLQSLGESVRLRREASAFHLLIAGRAGFATGVAALNGELQRELQTIAEILVEFEHTLVVVNTHTDASGPEEYNQALSERRSLRVAEALVDNGVDPGRVVAVGHGESEPVADNDTASGRARNRRIEILVEAIVREPRE